MVGVETILTTASPEETEALGRCLGKRLGRGDVVALYGELGVGKTTLIRGICRELGVEEPVTSPTFVLLHIYSGRLPVYHFDAYRLAGPGDLWEIGAEEYLGGEGVALVEWAERAQDLLPPAHLPVRLEYVPGRPGERRVALPRREGLP